MYDKYSVTRLFAHRYKVATFLGEIISPVQMLVNMDGGGEYLKYQKSVILV